MQHRDAVMPLAVQSDGVMGAGSQDAFDQVGEHGPRAHLHEGANTVFVHGFDQGNELDRFGDLASQQAANLVPVVRVRRPPCPTVDVELG